MSFDLAGALDGLRGTSRLLICPHDDPDPDALAAAWALSILLEQEIGCETTLAFEGIIGRAENRAMVRTLGIRLRRLGNLDLAGYDGVALVDTQPEARNHSAPRSLPALVCVDHHPRLTCGTAVPWFDVRPEGGCTSSIVLGYLDARGVEVGPPLATAVLYALKTDTRDLSREAHPQDLRTWARVSPIADMGILGEIVHPRLDARYFQMLHRALGVARIHDGAVTAFLGPLPYPDLVAEFADLFVRRKGSRWCLCAGTFQGALRLSLRTEDPAKQAGQVAQELAHAHGGSAGGHGMSAGGRIPLAGEDIAAGAERLWADLVAGFTRRLRLRGEPVDLIDRE